MAAEAEAEAVESAKAESATLEAPAVGLARGYLLGGAATSAAWAACATSALATYKPWRITHNSIGVAQALTALPLVWACCAALSSAARAGRARLRRPEFRRLNLGLASASLWSAVTVVWAPAFTSAVVRTADPVSYSALLRLIATSVHLGVAALCLDSWRRSVDSPSTARLTSGTLAALWSLGPRSNAAAGQPDASPPYAIEWSSLSLSFGLFSMLAVFAPFPLATVPSLLGKRLGRAFGAWSWLAAVVLHVLKVGAEAEGGGGAGDGGAGGGGADDAALDATTASFLRRGVLGLAAGHLLVALVRFALEGAELYPAAMECVPAVAASLCVYLLAAATAARDEARQWALLREAVGD